MEQGSDIRRVLYILASPGWGGGEEYIYRIMEALRRNPLYDCYAVTMSGGNNLKMSAVADSAHLFDFRPGSLADAVSAVRIARIVDRNRIGIIHVNKFSHAFIALWARAISRSKPKIVMTRHLIKKAKTGPLYNWLYGRLDSMIFVSEIALRKFSSSGPKPARNTVVIHNGVPDMPQNPALRDQDGLPVVAFAGRLVPDKGVEVLIDAAAKLKESRFRVKVIGTGADDYVAGLRNRVNQLGMGGKVSFTGFTDDVNAALQEAHIGVAPSVTPEPFGLTIAEYMRSGLAVVTTDNGAQPEFVNDGTDALLVPPNNSQALAEALDALLSDTEKRKKMGAAARKTFEQRLTLDTFLAKLTEIYDRVCG